MKTLTLTRVAEGSSGTFGVLIDEGIPFALTLEPPWKNNEKNISCIPMGEYECADTNSVKFGYTFEVKDVPGRSHILFHTGNYTHNTKGCILVGEQFEDDCIHASAKGYKEFMSRLVGCGNFILKITEAY